MSDKNSKDSTLSEAIKRVVTIGVGAAFMTEDAIKGLIDDLSLPKNVLNGLIQNAKTAKSEFVETVREELSEHLSQVDPRHLMDEMLQNYDIEVKATFSFRPKKSPSPTKKKAVSKKTS